MTITFSAGDETPVDLLSRTDGWLSEATAKLAETVDNIRQGKFGVVADATVILRDLKQTILIINDERARLDKFRKQIVGEVGAGPLDLDAARAEVGRRLACLRDAGDD